MSNLGSVLKNEITRLARKEIRAHVDPLRKANAGYRREIANLKRMVAELERRARAASKAAKAPETPAEEGQGTRLRITGHGVKSLRDRLGLSQGELARLTGASPQSVYNWENGATPRAASLAVLAELRRIGKREAKARLEQMAGAPRRRKPAAA